eukprot:m.131177 g.131177  ORF g.131177 m.131177 type:complete len:256 (+) comp14616_c0_seq3:892-1659(+)
MDALWTYAHSFRWEYGVTPLSSLQAIGCAWLCYFTTLILLQKFMEGREPFKLRQVTALHNLILMIWSAGMFASVLYGLWLLYDRYGYASLFCAANDEQTTGIVAFSLYVYHISKFYELFDTVIIILKKKKLIFLHWYHHSIVMVMTWIWNHYRINVGSQGMLANTLVHVFMYYFYFQSALGNKVWFKKYITSMQIVQFFVSFLITVEFKRLTFSGPCIGGEFGPIDFTVLCNVSFFILFLNFYRKTYSDGNKKKE